MMQAPLVAAADHAGKVAAPESFLSTELDIIGRFIVHNLNGTTFGILTLIALAGMIWYRNKRGLPVHRSHCFRLIAGALEVYLAVTLCGGSFRTDFWQPSVDQKKHADGKYEHERAAEQPKVQVKISNDSVESPSHSARAFSEFEDPAKSSTWKNLA